MTHTNQLPRAPYVSPYTQVCNLLLQAQAEYKAGRKDLGTSCLVAAEQMIPSIDKALEFLAAQNAADKIWSEYLVGGGLEVREYHLASSFPPCN